MRLLPHLKQLLRPDAARILCHVHAGKAHKCAGGLVCSGGLHGFRLRADEVGGGHAGIAQHGAALQILDHLFVLVGRRHGVDAHGDDTDAAQPAPLAG